MKKLIHLLYLSISVSLSCTYSPTSKYVNPIQPPPDNSNDYVRVDINQFNNSAPDPYPILWNTHFFFALEGPNQHLKTFSVKLDEKEILNGLGGYQMQFQIDPTTLSNGNHNVEVDMVVDPGTGSLADALDKENFTVTKSFTIVVDKVPPDPISSLGLDVENGRLTMKWNQLSKTNFTLHVQRSYWKGNTTVNLPDTTIASTLTSFVDHGYVGGKVMYTLFAQGVGFVVNSTANFNLDPINSNISVGPHNTAQISWGQPNVGSFNSISVSGLNGVHSYSPTANTISGDTLILGGNVTQTVTIHSSINPLQNFDNVLTLSSTKRIPAFSQIFSLATQSEFILQSKSAGNLYRHLFSNFAKSDSSSFNVQQVKISSNGQYGVVQNGNQFLSINPLNLSQTSSLPSWTSTNTIFSSLSNNNFISITDPGDNVAVYDLSTGSSQSPFWAFGQPPAILSDDGQYLYVQNSGSIYNNTNPTWPNQWPLIGKVSFPCSNTSYNSSISFRNNGFSEVLVFCGSQVQVYAISPQGISTSRAFTFSVPSWFATSHQVNYYNIVPGFDQAAQVIWFETKEINNNNSTLWLYDAGTFAFKGRATAISINENHFMSNGYQFVSSGYAEKIL